MPSTTRHSGPPHVFVDISSHGFGHLAIAAPVLNALTQLRPEVRLTVRSGLPQAQLRQRIDAPFELIAASSDFGFHMQDATRIDYAASATAYRAAHADWPRRVADEAALLRAIQPDLVLANVSYLPLAGAAAAGIPSLALCSLNWADLFAHFFAHEPWAAPIHADILAAYRSTRAFLRITPGMPMPLLERIEPIGPIAARGRRHALPLGGAKAVLVAMGGIPHALSIERWPRLPGIRWLVPGHWPGAHPDAVDFEDFGLSFTDLLCSVEAIVTKPGYGTFAEAACNGTPVLYQRRDDWPEQDCLIDWLHTHGRCREISRGELQHGQIAAALAALWQTPAPAQPASTGCREAAQKILSHLR